MFVLMVLAVVGISRVAGPQLSLYGAVALTYLAVKLALSMAYRPSAAEIPDLSVAVVIPTYNEDPETFRACLHSVLSQTITPRQVVVVDDGSDDAACALVALEVLACHDNTGIRLHRLASNQGKRHAQVAAIRSITADIIVTIDSDTVLDPSAIAEGLRPFARPGVQAVTGDVRVLNEKVNLLTRLTSIRYTNAFGWERAAYSSMGAVLCGCGSLSLWRREVILDNLDDYRTQTFLGVAVGYGDDRRLTNYALQRGRVEYQSTAVAHTAVPETLSHFVRQQTRWNKSFFRETLWALRNFPIGHRVWIASFAELTLWVLFTTALVVVAIAYPLIQGTLPSPWYPAFIALMAWARSVRYLGSGRGTTRHQLAMFALAPLYGLLHLVILMPVRIRSLLGLRDGGWGTRQLVEVRGLASPEAVPALAAASMDVHSPRATAPRSDRAPAPTAVAPTMPAPQPGEPPYPHPSRRRRPQADLVAAHAAPQSLRAWSGGSSSPSAVDQLDVLVA